jgi:hypothetical protein
MRNDAKWWADGARQRVFRLTRGGYEPTAAHDLDGAIALSRPGDVIKVSGSHGPLQTSDETRQDAYGPVDIVLRGGSRDATINGVVLYPGMEGGITLQDLTIKNRPNVFAPVWMTGYEAVCDRLRVHNCRLQGSDDWSWGGFGQKWQIKGTGYASKGVTITGCDLRRDGAQEHNVYLSGPMGRNLIDGCRLGHTTRTAVQIANRVYPNGQGGDDPRYTPHDWRMQESFHVRNSPVADIHGSGGSAFTIAGFWGHVVIEDCPLTDSSFGYVVASSSSWHGTPLNGRGYATGRLTLLGGEFNLPNVSRDHIMLSGVQNATLDLRDAHFSGNKTAISLVSAHGGGLDNGAVTLRADGRPSRSRAFQTWKKMKLHEVQLTDREIDAYGPKR